MRNRDGYKLIRFRRQFDPRCGPDPGEDAKPDEFYDLGGERWNAFAIESAENRIAIGAWRSDADRAAYEALSALLPQDEEAPPEL